MFQQSFLFTKFGEFDKLIKPMGNTICDFKHGENKVHSKSILNIVLSSYLFWCTMNIFFSHWKSLNKISIKRNDTIEEENVNQILCGDVSSLLYRYRNANG